MSTPFEYPPLGSPGRAYLDQTAAEIDAMAGRIMDALLDRLRHPRFLIDMANGGTITAYPTADPTPLRGLSANRVVLDDAQDPVDGPRGAVMGPQSDPLPEPCLRYLRDAETSESVPFRCPGYPVCPACRRRFDAWAASPPPSPADALP